MKAERALLLQLEASRHHVNDNTGHAEADKHAEEASYLPWLWSSLYYHRTLG